MSTTIYAYTKKQTPVTTVQMALPDSQGANDELHCTELCMLDGVTYVAVPDGVTLPDQPTEITLEAATLTPELKAAIKAASAHVALISERMIQKIRGTYTIDDEMFFARIGVGAATGMYAPTESELADMQLFGSFVESVRDWGRAQRASLGL